MVVESAAKGAVVVNTGIAENGGHSDDGFLADVDEEIDGNFSAKVTLGRGFSERGRENVFEEGGVHFASVDEEVQVEKETLRRNGDRMRWGMRTEGDNEVCKEMERCVLWVQKGTGERVWVTVKIGCDSKRREGVIQIEHECGEGSENEC